MLSPVWPAPGPACLSRLLRASPQLLASAETQQARPLLGLSPFPWRPASLEQPELPLRRQPPRLFPLLASRGGAAVEAVGAEQAVWGTLEARAPTAGYHPGA